MKLLDAGIIYPISDSNWVSPIHIVPKKGGVIVIRNEHNELIPTRAVTGWRMCIDNRKLNKTTRKDHFPSLYLSLISSQKDQPNTYFSVTQMATRDSFRFSYILRKKKPSHVLMALLPTDACPLGYAMPLLPFKGA